MSKRVSESWWRHQMGTFSALLAICAENSPVTGEFPTQRPVTRSFDVFFYLRANERLSKHLWGWWFETPSCPLWRHCNAIRLHNSASEAIKLPSESVIYILRNCCCVHKNNISLIASRLFVQQFVYANEKVNINAPNYWPVTDHILLSVTGGFPSQRTSNAESVSIYTDVIKLLKTEWEIFNIYFL